MLGGMSADQPLAGRHQRLLEWDEVELPEEKAPASSAAPTPAATAKKGKEEPASRMDRLRSILNRKIG